AFESIAQRLKQRLMDYENPVLAAPQRRFLMKELQKLSSPKIEFPTLAAEELAAEFPLSPSLFQSDGERERGRGVSSGIHRASLPGLWQFTTHDRRVLALVRTDKLVARNQAL